ncbi:MAG: MarR family winged helix-turn-helix transcriptional regulator [Candidatus Saccharimonadales bacterium]
MRLEKSQEKLTAKQYGLLVLLYKFRYISIPLLTEYKNLKSNSLQRNFDNLLEKELIERQYDLSYKIDRVPAVYYLAKKGIAFLKKDDRLNTNVLHSYYKNKSLSSAYIRHKLDVLTAYNALKACYRDSFRMFTEPELSAFEDFPDTKPDLFLRSADGSKEYFIVLAHDAQPFLIRKQLAEYIEHSEEEGWEVSNKYPTLLFVFADNGNETRFMQYAKGLLENAGIDEDELRIGTTTIKALLNKPYTSSIWSYIGENKTPAQLT